MDGFPADAINISLVQSIQIVSGAHSASSSVGTGASFHRGIELVKLTTHLNLMSRVRMCGALPPFFQTTFRACRGIALPCTVPE